MAVPGRKPQPTELKLLKGRAPGRDSGGRRVQPGPSPVKAIPKPPSTLPREALAEWKRITPELHRLGLLSQLDRAALTAYCRSWARYVSAERQLDREGAVVVTKQGPIRHPAWQVARESQREMRAWSAEFGLSPSSRGRMTLPGQEGEDDPDLD